MVQDGPCKLVARQFLNASATGILLDFSAIDFKLAPSYLKKKGISYSLPLR